MPRPRVNPRLNFHLKTFEYIYIFGARVSTLFAWLLNLKLVREHVRSIYKYAINQPDISPVSDVPEAVAHLSSLIAPFTYKHA